VTDRRATDRGATDRWPPGAQFGMALEFAAHSTVLSLSGELDALSVPVFAGALTALADQGARIVTIDLTDLRFCNIGGLRAMAQLAARLHDGDGRVEIVAPAILTRMLELSDLRSLFVVREADARVRLDDVIDLRAADRPLASSRPRAGSRPRLPSGA
jgi:anti-anti-sigma factor